MSEELNLIYKENDSVKTFLSENFNFIYDKKTNTSLSWGKSKQETPDFDEIGPEKIKIHIDDSFKFDEHKMSKVLSVNIDDVIDESYFASTLSEVVIFGKSNADLLSKEALKLEKFFEKKNIFVSLAFDDDFISLKNIVKMKSNEIKNITIFVKDVSSFNEKIRMVMSNDIFSSVVFHIDSEEAAENFMKYAKDLPDVLAIRLEFDGIDDELENKIVSFMEANGFANAYVDNFSEDSIGKSYRIATNEYSEGLFSASMDLVKDTVYCDSKTKFKLENVNNVADFWFSSAFKKYRNKILKKINSSKSTE